MNPTREFVGTWEEIVARSDELAGQRVRVTVLPATEPVDAQPKSARPIWEEFDEAISRLPASELQQLPVDGAENHDRYLYGDARPPA